MYRLFLGSYLNTIPECIGLRNRRLEVRALLGVLSPLDPALHFAQQSSRDTLNECQNPKQAKTCSGPFWRQGGIKGTLKFAGAGQPGRLSLVAASHPLRFSRLQL